MDSLIALKWPLLVLIAVLAVVVDLLTAPLPPEDDQ